MDGVYLITCFPSSNCKPPEWLGWKGLISRETKNLSFQLIPVANLPKMGYQNAWIRYEKAGLPIGQQTLPSIEQPKVGAKKKPTSQLEVWIPDDPRTSGKKRYFKINSKCVNDHNCI